jgi:WD40 repeat protein/serine/threonine protein kinase
MEEGQLEDKTIDACIRLDKYKAAGAAGEVYSATLLEPVYDMDPGQRVAVKVYKTQILERHKELERIEREFRVGSELRHPNLMKIYGLMSGHIDGQNRRCLVCELLEGSTLREYVERGHPLKENDIVSFMQQLCDGVDCLHHAGVVHRDIKPDNVMIVNDTTVKLMDYGVAKDPRDKALTKSNEFLGTILYAAPEYLFDLDATEKSDSYSIGAVLYFMVYGHDIFRKDALFSKLTLWVHSEEVSLYVPNREGTKTLCLLLEVARRMLEKDPDKRLTSRLAASHIHAGFDGELWKHYIVPLVRWRVTSVCGFKHARFPKDFPLPSPPRAWAYLPEELYEGVMEALRDDDWPLLYLGEDVHSVLAGLQEVNELLPMHAISSDSTLWRQRYLESTCAQGKIALLRAVLCRASQRDGDIEELKARILWAQTQEADSAVKEFCRDCIGALRDIEESPYYLQGRDATSVAQAVAERASRLAKSRELAARVGDALERDPELGLLVAMEAISATYQLDGTYSVEADGALRRALADRYRATLRGHRDSVLDASFSPDGQRMVTASADGTALVWDMDGRLSATLGDYTDSFVRASFGPDGPLVLTASSDGTARLWGADGKPPTTLSGHSGAINDASFSPDGRLLVTGSADHTLRLMDIRRQSGAVLSGHRGAVTSVSFNADGQLIVSASWDGTVRIWDKDGRLRASIADLTHLTPAISLHAFFSPDGQCVATTTHEGKIQLWNTDGEPLSVLRESGPPVTHLAFSPNGELALVAGLWAGMGPGARLYDMKGRQVAALGGHTGTVNHGAFSPDGLLVVTAGQDGTACLWNAEGQRLAVFVGHRDSVTRASFSPNGHCVVTASRDGTARLWSVHDWPLPRLTGHTRQVVAATFDRSGKHILTSSRDGTARLWDVEGTLIASMGDPEDSLLDSTFSPDGRLVLTSSYYGHSQLWDLRGRLVDTLKADSHPVLHSCFDPSGNLVVTTSRRGVAHLWDISVLPGQLVATLEDHSREIPHASFSPNGAYVVTASWDNTARLWNREGRGLTVLSDHTDWVRHATFTRDGQFVLTAGKDAAARLWSIDGTCVTTLEGHKGDIFDAALSPDGQHILTASSDGTGRLWNMHGDQLAVLAGHTGELWDAEFSPNRDLMVTGSADKTARLWDIDGVPVAVLGGHTDAVRVAEFCPNGHRVVTAAGNEARVHYVYVEEMMELARGRVSRSLTPEERMIYLGESIAEPE